MMKLAWLGAIASAALFACSSETAPEEPATGPEPPPGENVPAPGAPTTPAPGGQVPAPVPPAPGGPQTPPPPTQPPNSGVFATAPAYVATLGPSTIDTSGKGNGHLSFNKDGNPAGKACLDCHDGTGKGGAPKFLFAGTIYQDLAGTKVSSKVEVRMVGADGKALSTYTDVNGNYFFLAGAGTTTVPATAGARTATASRTMMNKINDGNCNSCHIINTRIIL